MNKLILAAAALAVFTAPALAENAKSGARTLTPFGHNYGSPASADLIFAPAGQALSMSSRSNAFATRYGDRRQGRADKK
jgi:hypothetical protein